MRAAQQGFNFDLFEMTGFSRPSVEDFEARERRAREKREREAREQEARRQREEQEARERWQRRQRARHNDQWQSPWEILGIEQGASKADARAAWVRLCKQHHPDAGGDPEAMKRVNRAWQELKGQMR